MSDGEPFFVAVLLRTTKGKKGFDWADGANSSSVATIAGVPLFGGPYRGWHDSVHPEVACELRVVVFEVVGQFDEGSGSGYLTAAEECDCVAELRILEGGQRLRAEI